MGGQGGRPYVNIYVCHLLISPFPSHQDGTSRLAAAPSVASRVCASTPGRAKFGQEFPPNPLREICSSPKRKRNGRQKAEGGRVGGGGRRKHEGRQRGRYLFCAPGAFRATSPKHSPSLACVDETRLRGTPLKSRGNPPPPERLRSY